MPSDHPIEIDVAEIRRLLPWLGVDADRSQVAFDALLAMGDGAIRPILELTRKTGKLAFKENGTHPVDFQDNLMFLLIDFGEPAVAPLIEELGSDAAILSPLFATVLGHLRDPRNRPPHRFARYLAVPRKQGVRGGGSPEVPPSQSPCCTRQPRGRLRRECQNDSEGSDLDTPADLAAVKAPYPGTCETRARNALGACALADLRGRNEQRCRAGHSRSGAARRYDWRGAGRTRDVALHERPVE